MQFIPIKDTVDPRVSGNNEALDQQDHNRQGRGCHQSKSRLLADRLRETVHTWDHNPKTAYRMNYDGFETRRCCSVLWAILAERVPTALNIMDPNRGFDPTGSGTQAMFDGNTRRTNHFP